MKCARLWVIAAVAAMAAGAASAESEAEYAAPAPPAEVAPAPVRPVARPALFAPAAAAQARRLTAQQREEWRFLKEASALSRFEAEASRMALARSTDAAVRGLATALIDHHGSAGNELEHLLHSRGMAQPMLSNDHRRILNRLAKMQGRKFDREFLEQVGLRNQQAELQLYEKAGPVATEPRLKAWIDRTLPALRNNIAAAERIAPAGGRLARGQSPGATMGSAAR